MAWTAILSFVALSSVLQLRQANAAAIQPPLLDCTSQIRLFLPHLFTHCSTVCQYSEWSDWQMVSGSTVDVPTTQCSSGEAYNGTRTRSSTAYDYSILGCTDTTQARQICMPDQADRIIMSLGLGNVGNTFQSVHIPPAVPDIIATTVAPEPARNSTFKRRAKRAPFCASQRICHSYGKRSSKLEKSQEAVQYNHAPKSSPSFSTLNSAEVPLPFDWNQHHHRFRRQATCGHQDTQYILFLLDTSGSVGSVRFQQMTEAISRINLYYCKPIQVAAMTFSNTFHVEFCFDCHDNTCPGRLAAKTAMANIPFRGGSTYTGGATKCACNFLLSQSCGLPTNPKCISVVYITDGNSNGPHNICNEVKCLHSRTEVETFAIGIGNINPAELDCITDVSDAGADSIFSNQFKYLDFDAFVNDLNEVQQRLVDAAQLPPDENNYKCINPTQPLEGGGNSCF